MHLMHPDPVPDVPMPGVPAADRLNHTRPRSGSATPPCGRRERGWVGQVAVLRPSRQRGIGRALLQQALGAFYRMGQKAPGLEPGEEWPRLLVSTHALLKPCV